MNCNRTIKIFILLNSAHFPFKPLFSFKNHLGTEGLKFRLFTAIILLCLIFCLGTFRETRSENLVFLHLESSAKLTDHTLKAKFILKNMENDSPKLNIEESYLLCQDKRFIPTWSKEGEYLVAFFDGIDFSGCHLLVKEAPHFDYKRKIFIQRMAKLSFPTNDEAKAKALPLILPLEIILQIVPHRGGKLLKGQLVLNKKGF